MSPQANSPARVPETPDVALPHPSPALRAVVVVPARDEADRIRTCLQALAAQREVARATYEVIVVLDGCRDSTASRVGDLANEVPSLALGVIEFALPQGVGRARKAGMDLACERLLALDRRDGLIASTDADSIVADDWLSVQLELVARGARAIGGDVKLLEEELQQLPAGVLDERSRRSRERMAAVVAGLSATDAALAEHHHFSGSSLALTAGTYRDCGGLPACIALEDEALERELRLRAIPIHRSRAVRVQTSARTSGRAPRGLAHDLANAAWRARRSYTAGEFPLERLLAAKHSSIALVLPSREVAQTIGPIASAAARLREAGLLDEVLVVDSASRDGTAEIASNAGLAVVQEDDLASELGPARGKGDAMWRALRAVQSDIVAFADTDSEDFAPAFITGLLGPLICEPGVWLVKGAFRRPFRAHDMVLDTGGGRVTELLARPLLNLHAPELSVFDQPLAGELAARRTLLDEIPFSAGYGVEIAMLIDAWRIVGLDGLAQVDLGTRQNRHQSLRELSAMAYEVLVAAQARLLDPAFADSAATTISLPALAHGGAMETRRVSIEERPPIGRRTGGQASPLAEARRDRSLFNAARAG